MRCASCGLEVSEAGGVCPTCGRVARGREIAPEVAASGAMFGAPIASVIAAPAEPAESMESAPAVVPPAAVTPPPAPAVVAMEPALVTPVGHFDGSGAWSAEAPRSLTGAEVAAAAPPPPGGFDASGAWRGQAPASVAAPPMPVAPVAMPEQGVPADGQAASAPVAPPSAPYGYAPMPGQPAPPSMPMAPVAPVYGIAPVAPGQAAYPGYVPLPPQPARRSARRGIAGRLIGALVAVVVVAACAGGLYLYGKNAPHTPPGLVPGDLTPTASIAPGMNLIYSDSLSGKATGWANNANCAAHPDGYHIVNGYICYAPTGELNDADITVTATQISGEATEAYGLVLRRASKDNYYSFSIDSNGKWVFLRCESTLSDCTAVDPFTANAAIHSGLNVSNTLEVRATGSHFDFFVNGAKVGQADDARFSSGRLGITGVDSGEVVYANMLVTQPSGS